jgi:hypothetical protein
MVGMGLQTRLHFEMRDCSWVPNVFENISPQDFDCKSDRDIKYNCIAWAVGKTNKFWWPLDEPPYWWPDGLPKALLDEETVAHFVEAFATEGYRPCRNGRVSRRYEKIVLFVASDGKPTHAARLLPTGVWTSKLGEDEDIEHKTLECIEGNLYGRAKLFFKKKIPRCQRTNQPMKFRSFLSRILRKVHGKFSPIPKENPTAS